MQLDDMRCGKRARATPSPQRAMPSAKRRWAAGVQSLSHGNQRQRPPAEPGDILPLRQSSGAATRGLAGALPGLRDVLSPADLPGPPEGVSATSASTNSSSRLFEDGYSVGGSSSSPSGLQVIPPLQL